MKRESDEYVGLTQEDLNLYFSGTYIRAQNPSAIFKDSKKVTPGQFLYILSFENTPSGMSVQAVGAAERGTGPLQNVGFDFSLPPVGAYNFRETVVLTNRRTLRQNKKGLSSNTYRVTNVMEVLRKYARLPDAFLMQNVFSWTDTTAVNTVFAEPKYLPVGTAWEHVRRMRAVARAVSPRFYLTAGLGSPNPSVWLNDIVIGEMPDYKTVQVNAKPFLQEACDFFQDKGVTVNG